VFLEGQWLDVPDDAVLTQPNLYGRTVVWPIKMYVGMTIRFFIPGSIPLKKALDPYRSAASSFHVASKARSKVEVQLGESK
jgi:hypothetical protein